MSKELDALRRVNFDWVLTLDSVWSDAEPAAGGPNESIVSEIASEFIRETKRLGDQPVGYVMTGPAGVGKTHMIGRLRRLVWSKGGWFVVLDVLGLSDFWRTAALSYLTALMHQWKDGSSRQIDAVLAGVARRRSEEFAEQIMVGLSSPAVDLRKCVTVFLKVLADIDMSKAIEHSDVFRAMCCLRSTDFEIMSLGHAWLQGYDADPDRRIQLGLLKPPPDAVRIVAGLSWVMGIAGPTLVALDQIDGLIDASRLSGDDSSDGPGMAEVLGAGLVELHQTRSRGMTVLTCLEETWERLKARSTKPLVDRFRPEIYTLKGMNDRRAASGLVASRLAPAFAEEGLEPTYPTWPFRKSAIDAMADAGIMPRTLLMRCDAHRRTCLASGKVVECADLRPKAPPPPPPPPPEIDFASARARADIPDASAVEDAPLGRVLRHAFDLYALETPPHETIDVASKGDPEQRIPPLHGRLTFTYHAEKDRERHVCYRGLPQTNAVAFCARLRAALTSSGISSKIADRGLVLARRGAIPTGPRSRELFERFTKAGGVAIDPSDDDLRTFVALRELRESAEARGKRDAFEAWLRKERPLRATAFFRAIGLGEEAEAPPAGAGPAGGPGKADAKASDPASEHSKEAPPPGGAEPPRTGSVDPDSSTIDDIPPTPDAIPIGHRPGGDGAPVLLPLKLLPRHTAIIAGAGSGKTVLLRRMVEEAALCGIPSIVVDPNNDLSRLGDPWPERPAAFTPEDDAKARRYARDVEVVVWTPGANAGNPLFLSALPDFASVKDDPDECEAAVAMAAEALGPLAGAKGAIPRGVLTDALRAFAARGGGELNRFIALLADLPEGASRIGKADQHAAKMADQLEAAVSTNPLLKVGGPVLDPQTLFFGPDPKRTRISVVNLSGLASDMAREDFVNRLQMALFGWIKKHPSPRGLLYVMDEAQIFLPSGKEVASLSSGMRLAAQARKYGLGLVVATQVPKGIHNQIVSNCTTQVFGRQSAPITIAAARDMVAAKGGTAADIGKLMRGEFYFATEGSDKPRKVETPLCLTHHPANPPSPDEVVARAARARGAPPS